MSLPERCAASDPAALADLGSLQCCLDASAQFVRVAIECGQAEFAGAIASLIPGIRRQLLGLIMQEALRRRQAAEWYG